MQTSSSKGDVDELGKHCDFGRSKIHCQKFNESLQVFWDNFLRSREPFVEIATLGAGTSDQNLTPRLGSVVVMKFLTYWC